MNSNQLIHDPSIHKLGARPAVRPRGLRMMVEIAASKNLPTPPANVGWANGAKTVAGIIAPITSWGMDGNDQYGDCLVGGTKVLAPGVSSGMKARYSGPVVTIVLASGKRLTITPNHAILTPRGFARACLLKKGDDVVSSSGGEQIAGVLQLDFNESPFTVEEKLAALRVMVGCRSRKVMPLPIDFDGDARFIDGDVDIVGSSRFLQSEGNVPLRQPHGHQEIGPARQLHCALKGSSATYQRFGIGGAPALGHVSRSHKLKAIVCPHLGIAQPQRFGLRAQFDTCIAERAHDPAFPHSWKTLPDFVHRTARHVVRNRTSEVRERIIIREPKQLGRPGIPSLNASRAKPSAKSHTTDPQLFNNLLNRFPGLIASEKIAEVYVSTFDGHVYDFSTDSHWYMAEGIVTHNCVFAGAAHMEQLWSTLTGSPIVPTTEQVLAEYSRLTGFNPADPNTDQGAVESDTWAAWQAGGLFGRKITAFVGVNPASQTEVKDAVWFFGGSLLGLDLPISCQNQTIWDVPPGGATGDGAPGSWGGHCTLVVAADAAGVSMVTWGAIKRATWAFMAAYCTEAYALLSPDWIEKSGVDPGGVPLKSLTLDLGKIVHA